MHAPTIITDLQHEVLELRKLVRGEMARRHVYPFATAKVMSELRNERMTFKIFTIEVCVDYKEDEFTQACEELCRQHALQMQGALALLDSSIKPKINMFRSSMEEGNVAIPVQQDSADK